MSHDDKLTMLMASLDMRSPSQERRQQLTDLLTVSASRLSAKGIRLEDTLSDAQLQVDYAAWLYRRRMLIAGPALPEFLRLDINDRLIRQAGQVQS